MFKKRFSRAAIGALLGVAVLTSSASAAAVNVGYQFPIPGGVSASSHGLDCQTWRNGDGTMHGTVTVMQPYASSFSPMRSSRVHLTTQLDYSTDNVNWGQLKLYPAQYANVTPGGALTGAYNFGFNSIDVAVTFPASWKYLYVRAWFKVDFVNSANQLVAPGTWSHQKAGPSGTRDRPTGRGQQNPIDYSELRRAGLAPEHTELVAKDEDLEILGTIVVTRANNEAAECPNDQAEEEQHRRILESGQSRIRVFDPHALPVSPSKSRRSRSLARSRRQPPSSWAPA